MKNRSCTIILCITFLFFGFLIGLFWGRNEQSEVVTISVPPRMVTPPVVETEDTRPVHFPINLNTATQNELEALPKIGKTLAFRILAYRRERGYFRNIYDLLNVEGMTESILSEIEDLIYVGGNP